MSESDEEASLAKGNKQGTQFGSLFSGVSEGARPFKPVCKQELPFRLKTSKSPQAVTAALAGERFKGEENKRRLKSVLKPGLV